MRRAPAGLLASTAGRLWPFLALALTAAPADQTLENARAALARDQHDQAAALALDALAAAPGDSRALVLLGRARFGAGRHEEALQAFEAGAISADAADLPAITFNRAATLFELGRHADAEAGFLAAARSAPELAPLATLNAAHAARAAGAPARAREHLRRAAALPGRDGLGPLVTELGAELDALERATEDGPRTGTRLEGETAAERAYALGETALAGGQYGEAARHFALAAELRPEDGGPRLMEGVAALRQGERSAARRSLDHALSLRLDGEDRIAARQLLDTLSPGLRARGRGMAVRVLAGLGFDSNAAQAGIARTEFLSSAADAPADRASAFGTASLDLTVGLPLGARGFAETGYGLDQLAYAEAAFDELNLQQHALNVAAEAELTARVRVSLATRGSLLVTGLERLTAFRWAIQAAPALAVDLGERATTRLGLNVERKETLAHAFQAFSGTRAEVEVAQEVRIGRGVLGASMRARREGIGTQREDLGRLPMIRPCPAGCNGSYVIPYGYRSGSLAAAFESPVVERFQIALDLDLERRLYQGESYIHVERPDGTTEDLNPRRRRDTRLSAAVAAGVRLGGTYLATFRQELVVNLSNVDNTLASGGHRLDYDNKNYVKVIASFEVSADF